MIILHQILRPGNTESLKVNFIKFKTATFLFFFIVSGCSSVKETIFGEESEPRLESEYLIGHTLRSPDQNIILNTFSSGSPEFIDQNTFSVPVSGKENNAYCRVLSDDSFRLLMIDRLEEMNGFKIGDITLKSIGNRETVFFEMVKDKKSFKVYVINLMNGYIYCEHKTRDYLKSFKLLVEEVAKTLSIKNEKLNKLLKVTSWKLLRGEDNPIGFKIYKRYKDNRNNIIDEVEKIKFLKTNTKWTVVFEKVIKLNIRGKKLTEHFFNRFEGNDEKYQLALSRSKDTYKVTGLKNGKALVAEFVSPVPIQSEISLIGEIKRRAKFSKIHYFNPNISTISFSVLSIMKKSNSKFYYLKIGSEKVKITEDSLGEILSAIPDNKNKYLLDYEELNTKFSLEEGP